MSDDLAREVRDFARARSWEQFHTPKNLAMAIAGEAGELAAEFQWLTPDQSETASTPGELRDRVTSELADVAIYLIRLADVLDIDIADAVRAKMTINSGRFPANSIAEPLPESPS